VLCCEHVAVHEIGDVGIVLQRRSRADSRDQVRIPAKVITCFGPL
jgi:hypothetical protein